MNGDPVSKSQAPPGQRTLHLVPRDVWAEQAEYPHYRPETFAVEGFIHCTNDPQELIAAGNRYYRQDQRPFVAVEIDCGLLEAEVLYEDARKMFPHIYGPLNRSAVVRVLPVDRALDGAFVAIRL